MSFHSVPAQPKTGRVQEQRTSLPSICKHYSRCWQKTKSHLPYWGPALVERVSCWCPESRQCFQDEPDHNKVRSSGAKSSGALIKLRLQMITFQSSMKHQIQNRSLNTLLTLVMTLITKCVRACVHGCYYTFICSCNIIDCQTKCSVA